MRRFAFLTLILAAIFPAFAEEADRRAFAGGDLTIAETQEGEKILAFDGRELARGWFLAFDRTVDVLILRLRRKIERNSCHPELIRTERGLGYQFCTQAVRVQ